MSQRFRVYAVLREDIRSGSYWLPFWFTFSRSLETFTSRQNTVVSYLWTVQLHIANICCHLTFSLQRPPGSSYPFHRLAFTSSDRLQHTMRVYELGNGALWLLCPLLLDGWATVDTLIRASVPCLPLLVSETQFQFYLIYRCTWKTVCWNWSCTKTNRFGHRLVLLLAAMKEHTCTIWWTAARLFSSSVV